MRLQILLIFVIIELIMARNIQLFPFACWSSCECTKLASGGQRMTCNKGYLLDVAENIKFMEKDSSVEELELFGINTDTLPALSKFTNLTRLTVAFSKVDELGDSSLSGLLRLQSASITSSRLRKIHADAFATQRNLQLLDLSSNDIYSLPPYLFQHTPLIMLNMSHNRLVELGGDSFLGVGLSLTTLDMSDNHLHFIVKRAFENLTNLVILNLSGNQLPTLDMCTLSGLSSLNLLHLDRNPWECNCGIRWMLELNETREDTRDGVLGSEAGCVGNGSFALKHVRLGGGDVACSTPAQLHSRSVLTLLDTDVTCQPPIFYDPLGSGPTLRAFYRKSVWLNCNASGLPRPSLLWKTPFHQVMAAPSNRKYMSPTIEQYVSDFRLDTDTIVQVFPNGTLYVSEMRGALKGTYICLAQNPAGVETMQLTLEFDSGMVTFYIWSLVLGGLAGALSVIAGVVTCVAVHCWTVMRKATLGATKVAAAERENVPLQADGAQHDAAVAPNPPIEPSDNQQARLNRVATPVTSPTNRRWWMQKLLNPVSVRLSPASICYWLPAMAASKRAQPVYHGSVVDVTGKPASEWKKRGMKRVRSWDEQLATCSSSQEEELYEEELMFDGDDEDDEEAAERRFGTVRDTLEEVRTRLRSGMERRVEKARSRVNKLRQGSSRTLQSLRESSSQYATWVREAGHQYANRWRAASSSYALRMREAGTHYAHRVRDGVVLGVEHVKYTMKSMKELCGTGDIMSTVSTFSVATDVDSQQQTEMVRTITFI